MANMTLEKAREIRLRAAETSRRELAAEYECSVSTIGRIVQNRSFCEPEPPVDDVRGRVMGYLGDSYEPEDDELIQLYVDTKRLRDRMQDELERDDLTCEYTNKAGATNTVKNPLIGEIKAHTAQMVSILAGLGLTRKQRLRMTSGSEGDDDGFEDF